MTVIKDTLAVYVLGLDIGTDCIESTPTVQIDSYLFSKKQMANKNLSLAIILHHKWATVFSAIVGLKK